MDFTWILFEIKCPSCPFPESFDPIRRRIGRRVHPVSDENTSHAVDTKLNRAVYCACSSDLLDDLDLLDLHLPPRRIKGLW